MENYIVINGKKAELTEEQLRQLGIGVKKNLWVKAGTFYMNNPNWICPNCGRNITTAETSLEKFHIYCGVCGHKNIGD